MKDVVQTLGVILALALGIQRTLGNSRNLGNSETLCSSGFSKVEIIFLLKISIHNVDPIL